MAKLYFRYGAMGSSKTANALMVKFNYEERGQKCLLIKPDRYTRDGKTKIKSRIGLEADAYSFTLVKEAVDIFRENIADKMSEVQEIMFKEDKGFLQNVDCIIIDEAQFLEEGDVYYLEYIVDKLDIPIICYGLRTDFQGRLFPASADLLAFSDIIEEIPTICWCGRKARFNARIKNGKMITSGEQYLEGGDESYIALCRRHFYMGALSKEDEERAAMIHDRDIVNEIRRELAKQQIK